MGRSFVIDGIAYRYAVDLVVLAVMASSGHVGVAISEWRED